MRSTTKVIYLSIFFIVTIIPFKTFSADEDTYELTYDQLLQKIKTKQSGYIQKKTSSSWDQVSIFPSFGFVQSVTKVMASSNDSYFQKGMQIAIGMELFSPFWYSETAYRNFGITKSNGYELSLKELDFKVGHKNLLSDSIEFRVNTGISTRHFRLTNEEIGFHNETSNPALITAVGLYSNTVNSPLMLGLEANYRSVLVSSPEDKGSLGLDFIFMGYF